MLDRLTPPPVHMMGDLKLPKPNGKILNNGVRLYYLSGGSQDVNQLSIVYRGGLCESPNPAIAKLTAVMMREGTKSMTSAEISEAIDFNGAMFRVGAEGHFTCVNVTSLNSKALNVLPIVHDVLTEPTFPKPMLETYKDIEAKELLLSKSRVSVVSDEQLNLLIKGPNNPNAHILTVPEIESVTVDDVRSFYRHTFTSRDLFAFLSGNITPEILDATVSMLESLPDRGAPMALNVMPLSPEPPQTVVIDHEGAVQASVSMGLPAIPRSHPDYIPLRFTVMALGGFFGSRLMKNIREDKGYTYGILSCLLGSNEGGFILINAQADRSYVDALIDEVKSELVRMQTVPLSESELICLRQYISSSLMETLDSPFSIMDYYRSIYTVDFPDGYFTHQVAWLHKITPEVIMEMAAKYLHPDQLRIAICK